MGFICADRECVCVFGGSQVGQSSKTISSKQNLCVWNGERDGIKKYRRSLNLVKMRMVKIIDM